MIDIGLVDKTSLIISGIDHKDHPDYCDAYYSYGRFIDGTILTDDQLDELKEVDSELFYDILNNIIY